MDDWAQLQHYAESRDEQAFSAIVNEHLGLVYATALRITRDGSAAEDVSQLVFIELEKKADLLSPRGSLASWLCQTTVFKSKKHLNKEQRRVAKETKGAQMSEDSPPTDHDADWQRMRPLIDTALETLPEPDRSAVLLRFFQQKSFDSIGKQLGTTDEAARKRVSRAITRLHTWFSNHGIEGTEEAMTRNLSALALATPPAHLFQETLLAATSGGLGVGSASSGSLTSAMLSKSALISAIVFGSVIPITHSLLSAPPPITSSITDNETSTLTTETDSNQVDLLQSEWTKLWISNLPPKGDFESLLRQTASIQDPYKRDIFESLAYSEWIEHGLPVDKITDDKLIYAMLEDLIRKDPDQAVKLASKLTGWSAVNCSGQLASVARTSPKALGDLIRLIKVPTDDWSEMDIGSVRLGESAVANIPDKLRAKHIRDAVAIAVMRDPDSASAILQGLTGWHRENALAGMIDGLHPNDFDQALGFLQSLDEQPKMKGRVLSGLLHQWVEKDPKRALGKLDELRSSPDSAKQFGNTVGNSTVRSELIAELAKQDLDAALIILRNENHDFAAASKMEGVIAREIRNDPARILDAIRINAENTGAGQALRHCLHNSSLELGPKVWSWCLTQEESKFVKEAARDTLSAISDIDPYLALTLYLQQPDLSGDSPPTSEAAHYFERSSLREVEHYLEILPEKHHPHFINRLLGTDRQNWPHEDQLGLLQRLPQTQQTYAVREMAERIAWRDPATAIEWAGSLPSLPLTHSAISGVVDSWMDFDAPEASSWVNDLDRGQIRSSATGTLVSKLIDQDNFDDAWSWAKDLDSATDRLRSLSSVLKAVASESSADDATRFLDDNDLSNQELETLRDELDAPN